MSLEKPTTDRVESVVADLLDDDEYTIKDDDGLVIEGHPGASVDEVAAALTERGYSFAVDQAPNLRPRISIISQVSRFNYPQDNDE